MLTARTMVFVVDKKTGEFNSPMTLGDWFLSLKGGSRWEDYEIATDEAEARKLGQKYGAIRRMVELMTNMTPEQADKAVDAIQDREDLMTLSDEYA